MDIENVIIMKSAESCSSDDSSLDIDHKKNARATTSNSSSRRRRHYTELEWQSKGLELYKKARLTSYNENNRPHSHSRSSLERRGKEQNRGKQYDRKEPPSSPQSSPTHLSEMMNYVHHPRLLLLNDSRTYTDTKRSIDRRKKGSFMGQSHWSKSPSYSNKGGASASMYRGAQPSPRTASNPQTSLLDMNMSTPSGLARRLTYAATPYPQREVATNNEPLLREEQHDDDDCYSSKHSSSSNNMMCGAKPPKDLQNAVSVSSHHHHPDCCPTLVNRATTFCYPWYESGVEESAALDLRRDTAAFPLIETFRVVDAFGAGVAVLRLWNVLTRLGRALFNMLGILLWWMTVIVVATVLLDELQAQIMDPSTANMRPGSRALNSTVPSRYSLTSPYPICTFSTVTESVLDLGPSRLLHHRTLPRQLVRNKDESKLVRDKDESKHETPRSTSSWGSNRLGAWW